MVDEQVVEAIEQVIVGSVAITARALGDESSDLTLLQWRVLVVVGAEAAGLHVGMVARRIGTSPPSASRILRRLEDRGLVELVRHDTDRRFMLVQLTDQGQSLRRSLNERRRELIRSALKSAVDPLRADSASLAAALRTIAAALLETA